MHCLTEATVVPVPGIYVNSEIIIVQGSQEWQADLCRPGRSIFVVVPWPGIHRVR